MNTSERTSTALDWEAIRERLRRQEVVQERDLDEIFRQRAQALAKSARAQAGATIASHLECVTAGITMLVPITHVLRILRPTSAAELPGAPLALRRIMHVSGSIVAIVDLSHMFGSSDGKTQRELVILLGHGKQRLALATDQIRDLRTIDERSLTPAAHGSAGSEFVTGLGPDLQLVLDVPRLIDDLTVSGEPPPLSDDRTHVDQNHAKE